MGYGLQGLTDWVYAWVLTPMLLGSGLYFSIRTGWIQLRGLPKGLRALREGGNLRAMLLSAGARIGTGNIAGVAAALSIGGPGAVLWMWVTAVIGGATAFAESTLAQRYRTRRGTGYVGGAAYYMKSHTMGVLFTLALLAAFGGAMNALQAYQMRSALEVWQIPGWAAAAALAGVTALCLCGGMERVSRWMELLVPVMALVYLTLTTGVLIGCADRIPTVLNRIFSEAFQLRSAGGGVAGGALSIGIRRGLFTNEAGMGSATQAAASAASRHPAEQGMAQVCSVFLDTLVLCTASALLILLPEIPRGQLSEIAWVQASACAVLGDWAAPTLSLCVLCFAFTSILGGCFYAETAVTYLSDREPARRAVRALCLTSVLLGALAEARAVWLLTDCCMAGMTLLNLSALLRRRREVRQCAAEWD